jgi:hypothetical protein
MTSVREIYIYCLFVVAHEHYFAEFPSTDNMDSDVIDKLLNAPNGKEVGRFIARNPKKYALPPQEEEDDFNATIEIADRWMKELKTVIEPDHESALKVAEQDGAPPDELSMPWVDGARTEYIAISPVLLIRSQRYTSFWGTLGASLLHLIGSHYAASAILTEMFQNRLMPSHQGVSLRTTQVRFVN